MAQHPHDSDHTSGSAGEIGATADAPAEIGAIVVVLELPPNRGNQRGQTRYESFAKRRLWARYDAAVARGEIPPAPPQPLECVTIRYDVKCAQLQDWDNAHARMKHASDWLVRAGYIVDDSPRVIPECPTLTQRVSRKGAAKVEVTITPRTLAEPARAPRKRKVSSPLKPARGRRTTRCTVAG